MTPGAWTEEELAQLEALVSEATETINWYPLDRPGAVTTRCPDAILRDLIDSETLPKLLATARRWEAAQTTRCHGEWPCEASTALAAYEPELQRLDQMEAEIERLRAALREAVQEIEYAHADMLTAGERAHPRGSGWARVYDKALAALPEETEAEAQRRSFAFGTIKLHNPKATREDIDRAANTLDRGRYGPCPVEGCGKPRAGSHCLNHLPRYR